MKLGVIHDHVKAFAEREGLFRKMSAGARFVNQRTVSDQQTVSDQGALETC